VRTVIFDKTSGLLTAQAVTAALLARTKSGEGAYLPISMLSSALYFSWPDTMWNHTLLDDGATNEGILADYFDVYQTRDGWVSVILVYDREFKALCEHVGSPLNEDPRFATLPQRILNATDLRSALDRILSKHPTETLCRFFDDNDIPCAAVNTISGLHEDPQVVHEQLLFEINHPVAGTMRQARPAAPFVQVEELGGPAPMLGQHNAEVLGSVGIAEADIGRVENATRKAHETIKAMINA
jgi:crotonobetainyl-CoA:carnitine CoA-transferase CaiB-like acyl-CoA transferase